MFRVNRKIKEIALLISVFLVCLPCAFAQEETSGTIIVFGVSDQFITVAADSEMFEPDTGQKKTQCKIATLSDKSIFSFTGMTYLQSTAHPEMLWDAYDQARKAFYFVRKSGIRNNPEFLKAVALQWTQNAKNVFTQMTHTDAAWFWRNVQNSPHLRAAFCGFDEAGRIGVVEVRIELIPSQHGFENTINSYHEDKTVRFFAIGETQIAAEFILLKTSRARLEYTQWLKTAQKKSQIKQASLRTIDLVQLSIRYLPKSARVGPPISAASLDRTGTVQWVPGKACQ